MDDGVELVADLYVPVAAVDPALPTIVVRSPYGRKGSLTHAPALAREGFTVLVQSCRGTGGSGGTFVPQVDEARDGMATHRWVRHQPWFTGAVATFGESYLGYTQWAVAGRLQRDDPDNAPDALCLNVTMADFGATTRMWLSPSPFSRSTSSARRRTAQRRCARSLPAPGSAHIIAGEPGRPDPVPVDGCQPGRVRPDLRRVPGRPLHLPVLLSSGS